MRKGRAEARVGWQRRAPVAAAIAAAALIPAGAVADAEPRATVTIYKAPTQIGHNPQAHAYGGFGYGGLQPGPVGVGAPFAVILERREIELSRGESHIGFAGVAARIDPATVQFKSATDPDGTSVIEQQFAHDLASPDALLARYVDREVTVVTNSGELTGTLLAFDSRQIVIRTADRKHPVRILQRGEQLRDIRFGAPPEGLVTRPTLNWKIRARKPGKHLAEVTYRASGLSWSADYTAIFDDKKGAVDLNAWVSLTNSSGATYGDARVVLVTGQVDSPAPQPYSPYGAQMHQVSEGMQVYALEHPTTLADRATVQLELFAPVTAARAKEIMVYEALPNLSYFASGYPNLDCYAYQYQAARGHSDRTIEVAAARKGVAYPEGRARVFRRGKEGALELIGEDLLRPVASGVVRLRVGSSDVVRGERHQRDCLPDDRARQMREKIELVVKNTGKSAAEVVVREYMQRWVNWVIESESETGERVGPAQEWRVKVPRGGSKSITYTVLYSW